MTVPSSRGKSSLEVNKNTTLVIDMWSFTFVFQHREALLKAIFDVRHLRGKVCLGFGDGTEKLDGIRR